MRMEDWAEQLPCFIEARRAQPFKYGTADCGLTVADWVLIATGHDPAADLRGRYRSAAGALRIIRQAGADSLGSLVTSRLGASLPPLLAQRGDIVEVPGDSGPALAICLGGDAIAMGPDGLVTVDMSSALRAWRI